MQLLPLSCARVVLRRVMARSVEVVRTEGFVAVVVRGGCLGGAQKRWRNTC